MSYKTKNIDEHFAVACFGIHKTKTYILHDEEGKTQSKSSRKESHRNGLGRTSITRKRPRFQAKRLTTDVDRAHGCKLSYSRIEISLIQSARKLAR